MPYDLVVHLTARWGYQVAYLPRIVDAELEAIVYPATGTRYLRQAA